MGMVQRLDARGHQYVLVPLLLGYLQPIFMGNEKTPSLGNCGVGGLTVATYAGL